MTSLESLAAIFGRSAPNGDRTVTLSCVRCLSQITAEEQNGRVTFTCSGGCGEDELLGALAEVEPRFMDWWLSGGITDGEIAENPNHNQGVGEYKGQPRSSHLRADRASQRVGPTSGHPARIDPHQVPKEAPPEPLGRPKSHDSAKDGSTTHDGRGIEERVREAGATIGDSVRSYDPDIDSVLRGAGPNFGIGLSSLETQPPRQGRAPDEAAAELGEDDLRAFEDNGHHLNGQALPYEKGETQHGQKLLWQGRVVRFAHETLKADPEYGKGWLTFADIAAPLQAEIFAAIHSNSSKFAVYEPPAWMTEEEQWEGVRLAAEAAWETFKEKERNDLIIANPQLPSEVVTDDYPDQHAIDLFKAFEAARAEAREDFWGGLGRRGRSIVITGQMGAGKSTLLICFARAAGLPYREKFLDRDVTYSKTLVICSSKEIEAWTDAVGFYELENTIFAIEAAKIHYSDRRKQVDWLVSEMTRLEANNLILDTMFDFFGMPPNTTGDINRVVMAEQAPLLEVVRAKGYGLIVSGHPPKGEAQNPNPRDPEEAFGGASAWTAQHRMRMRYRRTLGPPALMTGKGGYGDKGIFPEQAVRFDEETRLVSLWGEWKNHMGVTALPVVLDALKELGGIAPMSKLTNGTGKSEAFIRAGCQAGMQSKPQSIWKTGKGRSTKYTDREPEEEKIRRLL